MTMFKMTIFIAWSWLAFDTGYAYRTWANAHGDIHQVLDACSAGLKRILAEQEAIDGGKVTR